MAINQLHLRSDLHLMRKVWHMGIGVAVLTAYESSGFGPQAWGIIALTISFIALSVDLIRMRVESINKVVLKVMGPVLRQSEEKSVTGMPFFAAGCGLALLLFKENIAVLAIHFLVFADPISSFFGILFGKNKILPNKSLQGSAAGFMVCYIISMVYGLAYTTPGFSLLAFSFLAGLVGSFSELVSDFGIDDNLTIPVISGLGLTFLNYLFHIF
jgi:diacylglycerol kinase (CTP)